MSHIIWTASAFNDLIRLFSHLLPHSSSAAERAMQAIEEDVEVIAGMPGIGAETSGHDREWKVRFGKGAYLVRYRVENDAIVILAVHHSREQRI